MMSTTILYANSNALRNGKSHYFLAMSRVVVHKLHYIKKKHKLLQFRRVQHLYYSTLCFYAWKHIAEVMSIYHFLFVRRTPSFNSIRHERRVMMVCYAALEKKNNNCVAFSLSLRSKTLEN